MGFARRHVVGAVVAAAVVAVVTCTSALAAAPSAEYTEREGTSPMLTDKVVGFDRWIRANKRVPDVLVLGSSRGVQFDPRVIRQVTGRTAYNASISDTAAPGLLAMAQYADLRSGGQPPKFLIFADLETFDGRTPFPRMSDYVRRTSAAYETCEDAEKCAKEWKHAGIAIATDAARRQRGGRPAAETQRPDGRQIGGRLEQWERDGIDLGAIRDRRIQQRIDSYSNGGFERVHGPSVEQFARIIELANERGYEPFVILTTMHPDCIARCGPAGWSARRREVKAALRELAADHEFTLLDYSEPASWGGSANAFLDEIHIRQPAADAIIRALAEHGAYGRDGDICPGYRTLAQKA